MKSPTVALPGPRNFQWNTGGWFGSAFGGVAWMLPATGLLVYHGQFMLALVTALGVVVGTAASVWLWLRRDRIYPFTALMILLGVLAIITPLVWIAVATTASKEALAAMNWPQSSTASVMAALLVPSLMFWFYWMERSAHVRDDQGPAHNGAGELCRSELTDRGD